MGKMASTAGTADADFSQGRGKISGAHVNSREGSLDYEERQTERTELRRAETDIGPGGRKGLVQGKTAGTASWTQGKGLRDEKQKRVE